MAGPRKAYSKKRGEILEAAWLLFRERGYDATPVNRVIESAGISKGTFYHYFASKAELLEGVVERLTLQGFEELEPLLGDSSLGPLEKLTGLLASTRDFRLANLERIRVFLKVLHEDENAVIRRKLNQGAAALICPHLAEIIVQGNRAGVFEAPHPRETAEIIFSLGQAVGGLNTRDLLRLRDEPARAGAVKKRFRIYLESLRRILAAPPEAFRDLEDGFVDRITEAFGSGIENPRSR